MKRILAFSVGLFLMVSCAEGPTEPAPVEGPGPTYSADQALRMDGRAGQFPFASALIDASVPYCEATYADPVLPNSKVSSRFLPAEAVNITQNKNQVKATCKFEDQSGAYEANAETGPVENCTLIMEDGTVYEGGTGHLTSAVNVVDEVEGTIWGTHGNTTLKCTFDLK